MSTTLAMDEVFALISKYEMRHIIPANEMLCPPELAKRVLCENPDLASYCVFESQYNGVQMVAGMRVGLPCPKCGRRKLNKGKRSCDNCGAPLENR